MECVPVDIECGCPLLALIDAHDKSEGLRTRVDIYFFEGDALLPQRITCCARVFTTHSWCTFGHISGSKIHLRSAQGPRRSRQNSTRLPFFGWLAGDEQIPNRSQWFHSPLADTLARLLLESIARFVYVRNGRYRKLRRPAVVPRLGDPCGTRNQVERQADRRLSSAPPTAEATGVRSRIPRSLDPTHSFPRVFVR